MASKKKFPHTRRSIQQDNLRLLQYQVQDEHDKPASPREESIELRPGDFPDECYRHRSFTPETTEICVPPPDSGRDTVPYKGSLSRPVSVEKRFQGPPFDHLDFLVACGSIGFFFFDIITDLLLANEYYQAQDYWAFGLTASFVIGPCLVTSGLNLRWYILDFQQQQIIKSKGHTPISSSSTCMWAVRFIFTFFLLGPVIRVLEYMYNGVRSGDKNLTDEKRKNHYKLMRLEDVDACCIRIFECFMEAAPQLVLQLYIILSLRESVDLISQFIRGAAIVSSWLSLSWSLVSYHKALRYSHEEKENLKIPGMISYFLWRVFEIGPRVIALGLFAVQFTYIVFIVIGLHWMLMAVWLMCQKTIFYQNRCEERIFNIVCAYVLVFCFLNVRDGRTRYRALVYYGIVYIENVCMVLAWFYFTDDKSAWFYLPAFFTVILGIVVQTFFHLIYYRCFHPLGSGKIPLCPPEDEQFTCYQSLCHPIEDDDEQVPAAV